MGKVKGTNSKRVKFQKSLCAPCNNARSQTFDVAYSELSDFVHDHGDVLYKVRNLDMTRVYSTADARQKILDLARYLMKFLGCRIDEAGFVVPQQIRDFCDGADYMPNVEIAFYRDQSLERYRRAMTADNVRAFPLYHSGLQAMLDRATMLPWSTYGESIIGNIGVVYGWNARLPEPASPFYQSTRVPLHDRPRLPFEELYAEWPEYLVPWR